MTRFSPATQAWLDGAFAAPTPAQVGAWDAIARGEHTLVVAPTGSGKTLAAFLSALDRLAALPGRTTRCAAAACSTSARSRRWPSTSSATCARRWPASARPRPGSAGPSRTSPWPCAPATPRPTSAARSPARPPDILITTPESLFLLLTSAAREALRGVDTVIVDEVHAVGATKRGAHLALSPRAARRAARRAGPADRAVGHRPPGRRGRDLPGRRPAGHRRAAADREDVRARGRRPDRGHDRARRARPTT